MDTEGLLLRFLEFFPRGLQYPSKHGPPPHPQGLGSDTRERGGKGWEGSGGGVQRRFVFLVLSIFAWKFLVASLSYFPPTRDLPTCHPAQPRAGPRGCQRGASWERPPSPLRTPPRLLQRAVPVPPATLAPRPPSEAPREPGGCSGSEPREAAPGGHRAPRRRRRRAAPGLAWPSWRRTRARNAQPSSRLNPCEHSRP